MKVGQLMFMSFSQDGSGFPFLSPCIYEYLRGVDPSDIKITIEDVGDYEAQKMLQDSRGKSGCYTDYY